MTQLQKTTYPNRMLSDKEHKNLLFLDLILKNGPLSRADLCHLTGFNAVTVSNYVNSYLEKGLVIEKSLDESTGGRKPVLISLNPTAGFVIGVEVHKEGLAGVAMNLECRPVYEAKKDGLDLRCDNTLDQIKDFIGEILKEAPIERDKVVGIGLALPGVVASNTDWVPRTGFFEEESTVILLETLEKHFSLPFFIESDVVASAIAEKWLGLGRNIQHMIYLHSGLGCGIFIDGEIYQGAHRLAGELAILENEGFGHRSNLDFGICEAVDQRLKKGEHSLLSKIVKNGDKNLSLSITADAFNGGDALVRGAVQEAALVLGQVLSYLVRFLNPEMVVIGGGIEKFGSVFFDIIKNTIKEKAPNFAPHLRIIPSVFGEKAVTLGAAGIVVREVFKQAH